MGTYYALVNDTKKKSYHLDNHIKHGPITMNFAVQCAFVNVMIENQGDVFRIVSDGTVAYSEYDDIDLLLSNDLSNETHKIIVDELNRIYGDSRYQHRKAKGA